MNLNVERENEKEKNRKLSEVKSSKVALLLVVVIKKAASRSCAGDVQVHAKS